MLDVQPETRWMDQRAGTGQVTLTAVHIRVLNSLLFICDSGTEELPTVDGNGAVWSTPSCVAISCMPDCDGATEIVIGELSDVRGMATTIIFEGQIKTPRRAVVVKSVLDKTLLERKVSGTVTHLTIWTNGSRDTDKVIVGLA